MTAGEKLRLKRKIKRLTLKRLSELSGVNTTTIWRIEKGVTNKHHSSTFKALADALGVEAAELEADNA